MGKNKRRVPTKKKPVTVERIHVQSESPESTRERPNSECRRNFNKSVVVRQMLGFHSCYPLGLDCQIQAFTNEVGNSRE